MSTDFLGRAIDTVKKAIETDTAGEYEKAYQLYMNARMYCQNQDKQMSVFS